MQSTLGSCVQTSPHALRTQVFALCEALYEETSVEALLLPFNFLNDMAVQAIARLIQVHACRRWHGDCMQAIACRPSRGSYRRVCVGA